MNGRIYDPVVGRFLSPDPFMQAPGYSQGLNRYSYCLNNPLSLTDPGGYSWLGDNWKSLVSAAAGITVSILTAGTGTITFLHAVLSGAAGGFTGGFTGSLLNGGNLGDTVKAGVIGGVIGGLSAGAANKVGSFLGHEIGTFQKELARSLAHGSIGGLASMAQGGKFKHGFFAGSFASMAGSGMEASRWGIFQTTVGGTIAAAVVGGTASQLGGGKFANGAVTGAYTMLFNHLQNHLNAKKFQKEYFGQVKGLRNIFTDKTPDGYKNEGDFFSKQGRKAAGVTVYLGDGMSDVYLSKSALNDAFSLYEVLGHEMIHVAHHNKFLDSFSHGSSEFAAYNWSYNVNKNLYGVHNKVLFKVRQSYLKYRKNNYKYDNFGFKTTIPGSLWNW